MGASDCEGRARVLRYRARAPLSLSRVFIPSCPIALSRARLPCRAKDAVETDFRVIKSHLDLRPVCHHTDLKVRAHVTLCMLALLVERSVRHRLTKAGQATTADRALELLDPVRFCRFPAKNGKDVLLPSEPTNEQTRLPRALNCCGSLTRPRLPPS